MKLEIRNLKLEIGLTTENTKEENLNRELTLMFANREKKNLIKEKTS